MSIFKKVLSVGSGKLAQELDKKVELINSKESEVEKYSDDEIKNKFQNLKKEITSENKFDFFWFVRLGVIFFRFMSRRVTSLHFPLLRDVLSIFSRFSDI